MNIYRNREKFEHIIKLLDIPEVIVLHGARQVGKTTLMKMTMDYLAKNSNHDIFYFDLEEKSFLDLCNQGADKIIEYINGRRKILDSKNKVYVFIDEIQYMENPTRLLKIFYDHHKENFKLIVSGSSSFAIKSKFKDSLVGRIMDLEIFGLSFSEFLDFKNLNYDLSSDSELINKELKNLYHEYLRYGSYPQIVLSENLELKNSYLKSIIDKYIYKDIRNLTEIKNLDKFNNLLKFLASQSGQLLNINELANTLGIARQTVEQYIFIMESTYIIKLIRPFHGNVRNELSKMPKIYFEDIGILRLLRNKGFDSDLDGNIFENSIYTYIRKRFDVNDIFFWRTASKQEVDFIVNIHDRIIPFEVKITHQDKLMKNLMFFSEQYQNKKSFCVTLEKKESKLKNVQQIYPWEIEKITKQL